MESVSCPRIRVTRRYWLPFAAWSEVLAVLRGLGCRKSEES
jgi:hypothetical protein